MLSKFLSHLYLAIVTAAIGLWILCFVDQQWFDRQMFPFPQPNGWTWALWISLGLAAAPWIFAGAVLATGWALRHTIGVPSEMQPQPVPVRARSRRQ